jgi:hypothetical protein
LLSESFILVGRELETCAATEEVLSTLVPQVPNKTIVSEGQTTTETGCPDEMANIADISFDSSADTGEYSNIIQLNLYNYSCNIKL